MGVFYHRTAHSWLTSSTTPTIKKLKKKYDISTLWWCRRDTHSVGAVFRISNFDLFLGDSSMLFSHDDGQWFTRINNRYFTVYCVASIFWMLYFVFLHLIIFIKCRFVSPASGEKRAITIYLLICLVTLLKCLSNLE